MCIDKSYFCSLIFLVFPLQYFVPSLILYLILCMYKNRGVELKLARGEELFWTARAKRARKFLPLGMIIASLWAYFSNFFYLYVVRMAKSSGEGELPLHERLSQGNVRLPPTPVVRLCLYLYVVL